VLDDTINATLQTYNMIFFNTMLKSTKLLLLLFDNLNILFFRSF